MDTGTHEALTDASEFVKAIENTTSLKIACLEEIALKFGWINKEELYDNIKNLKGSYYDYIKKLIDDTSK